MALESERREYRAYDSKAKQYEHRWPDKDDDGNVIWREPDKVREREYAAEAAKAKERLDHIQRLYNESLGFTPSGETPEYGVPVWRPGMPAPDTGNPEYDAYFAKIIEKTLTQDADEITETEAKKADDLWARGTRSGYSPPHRHSERLPQRVRRGGQSETEAKPRWMTQGENETEEQRQTRWTQEIDDLVRSLQPEGEYNAYGRLTTSEERESAAYAALGLRPEDARAWTREQIKGLFQRGLLTREQADGIQRIRGWQ